MKKLILTLLVVLMTASMALAEGSFTVEWNANIEAVDGYKVYRSATTGPPYENVNDAGNATEYTTELLPEGTYYFSVTAYRGDIESGYSNEAEGVMPLTLIPPVLIRLTCNPANGVSAVRIQELGN